jgi:hypothetical protein
MTLFKLVVIGTVVAYSSDAVYLYSTHDEPEIDRVIQTPILTPNKPTEMSKISTPAAAAETNANASSIDVEMVDDDAERSFWIAAEHLLADDASELSDTDDEDEGSDDGGKGPNLDIHSDVPVVLPRSRYLGHCNVATVKDG